MSVDNRASGGLGSTLTLAQAARMIADKSLSPVELTEACIAGITFSDEQLCSFITPTLSLAREQAKRAEADIMKSGPISALHGIPYSLKDVFETKGIRTTGQSKLLADNIPENDCHASLALSRAGGVMMGKTTTWESAHGGPSWDVVAPPAHNPWNVDRHPAGSSSGSAAALAAGFCLATMGTDTGGSIRQPAGVCGVAGMKPTYGRVSRRGILPNSFSHDHSGPLAWNCEDLSILLGIVAGYDPLDVGSVNLPVPNYRAALSEDLRGLVIGVPYAWMEDEAPISAVSRAAIDAALDTLRMLGAEIRPVILPSLVTYNDVKRIIAITELYSIHREELVSHPELFGDSLRQRIIGGCLVSAQDYVHAMRLRTRLAASMQMAFAEVDLIVTACTEPAGPLAPVPAMNILDKPNYTTPFNLAGNPAVSVCCGFADDGMPLSMQIAGRLFDEAMVLRAGHAYERATPWRDTRPAFRRDN